MRVYNTLTRKEEDITERFLGIYVCGPTVYDEPHIGHARSAYTFDVLVRYLKYRGFKLRFVRNVTDIDDKIIDRARSESKEGSIKEKVREIAERYLTRYHEDMELLGLLRPDIEPKATELIPDMIEFIKILIERGYAYVSDGNVYFEVRGFKEYGRLSGQSLGQMREGARVSIDKNKKDPLDFALWKRSKEDEPSWPSPWGYGRPGWHIECSVMSTRFLGKNFLVHGGGLDLIFPHHENEIAQTVCAGKSCAKYWIHNGLLTIDGQKMSKSLGNFISIRDFRARYRDLDLLKLLFLASQYRHPVDYTDDKIRQMARSKERILIFLERFGYLMERCKVKKLFMLPHYRVFCNYRDEFIRIMDGDFNTPAALGVLFEAVEEGNKLLNGDTSDEKNWRRLKAITSFIRVVCKDIFNISLEYEKILNGEIERMIKERNKARMQKDYKKADRIREELFEKGIILEDTKEGTIWRKRILKGS